MQSNLIETLAETLPPIILRSKVGELTGGLICPKTLSNHDVLGKGPTESNTLYGKKVYSRKAFLDWLSRGLVQHEGVDNETPR